MKTYRIYIQCEEYDTETEKQAESYYERVVEDADDIYNGFDYRSIP